MVKKLRNFFSENEYEDNDENDAHEIVNHSSSYSMTMHHLKMTKRERNPNFRHFRSFVLVSTFYKFKTVPSGIKRISEIALFDSPISFRYVYLRCKVSNRRFPVKRFSDLRDDPLETALDNFPCDRL